MNAAAAISYNTLVVIVGVAAIGFAAGVIGSLGVLRKRALAGDAAAHATLAGVAAAFALTGRRDLPTLLLGALVAAVAALGALVLIRRHTRTRDDAATAIVLGVSFGVGIVLLSGITARGLPGAGGLEQFLMGHTAALTVGDAALLAGISAAAVALLWLGLKEATVVAFDPAFAAATGWPVTLIDYALITLVAVMVVVGLPAAGVVLVTALVVIPPVAARLWTDRVTTMLVLAGVIGLGSALVGVTASAVVPRVATGPMVVLVAAAIFGLSFLFSPRRGWLARRRRERAVERSWNEGRTLSAALALAKVDPTGSFSRKEVALWLGGGDPRVARAWNALALRQAIVSTPEAGGATRARWRLTAEGRGEAGERQRRLAAWERVLAESPADARSFLTIDLPAPEEVLDVSSTGSARRVAVGRPS